MITLRACLVCSSPVDFHKDEECPGCHYLVCSHCEAIYDFATTADPKNASEDLITLQKKIAKIWNRIPRFAPEIYDLLPELTTRDR